MVSDSLIPHLCDTPTMSLISGRLLTMTTHFMQPDRVTRDEVVPEWTLGDRLRSALRHADLSVADMAADLDVSLATIGRWLNDRGPVKRSILRLWAMTTGVSLEWLETGQAPTVESEPEELRACRDSNPKPSDLYLIVSNGVRMTRTPKFTVAVERTGHLRIVS